MSQTTLNSPSHDGLKTTLSPKISPTPARKMKQFASWLLNKLPTLLVFLLLAGVFYYGHRFEWKLPKFSTMAGTAAAEKLDWCEEHAVPESQCVACSPELMPPGSDYGWCAEHGVHNCPIHHPDVAQLKEIPSVTEADFARAARALATNDRKLNNAACLFYQTRIQFASVEAVRQAGVDVELVGQQPVSEALRASGEISYDQTRFASLSSRVPGTVWRVEKNIGDKVHAGEILAVVDAVEVGQAKTKLIQALAEEKLQQQNVSRLSAARDAVAGRKILEAEAALSKARAMVLSAEQSLINFGLPVESDQLTDLSEREVLTQLRFLGLPEKIRAEIGERMMTTNLVPIFSPMMGIVVDRQVVVGEVVDASRPLFQIADTSRMWLTLNIPLETADQLLVGQSVEFLPDGSTKKVTGKLHWISTAANKETRMVQLRAELLNPDGQLRDETFGSGQVILREEPNAIVIPTQAIHSENCCQIVFVRDKGYFDSPESPKVFHVRTVRLGVKQGEFTEVIAGLLPGEVVAVQGSDVLKAQLLKNNLGAGCCASE